MTLLLQISLLIIPWLVIPIAKVSDQFRLPKATFFDVICMAMICCSFLRGVNFKYTNRYIFYFLCWIFLSIFLTWYVPFTNTYEGNQQINFFIIEPYIHFLLGLWATYIALSYFDKEDFIKIAKTICFSSVLISVYGILQMVGLDPAGKLFHYGKETPHWLPKFVAFLGHPGICGNYLALSIPFFLYFKQKKYYIGLMIVFLGLCLSRSIISTLALAIGMIFFGILLFKEKRKILFVYISGIILFLSGALSFLKPKFIIEQLSGRQVFWPEAFKYFKDNPLFGQGLGIFKTFDIQFNGLELTHPHSDWFNLAIEFGLLGIFLLVLVLINSFRKFNYQQDNRIGFSYLTSLVIFLVIMLGSFPLQVAPIALLGIVDFWAVEKL